MSSRRSHYRHVFLLLLTFAWGGCGGGGGGGSSSFGPLPNENPNTNLFGVVELTAVMTSANDCPESVREGLGTSTTERYRLYATDSGCALSDKASNGSALDNNEELFDDEGITCSAGGNAVRLEESVVLGDSATCALAVSVIAQYTMNMEDQTLSGTYRVTLHTAGECNDDQKAIDGCVVDSSLTGRLVSEDPNPDESPIQTGEGDDSCTAPRDGPGCPNNDLENCVCNRDSYCCTTKWDDACVEIATRDCIDATNNGGGGDAGIPGPGQEGEPEPTGTTGLQLNLRIPDRSGGVSTACRLIFELCDPSSNCYRAELNEEGNDLERGGYYEFMMTQDDGLEGFAPLNSFHYPEDFDSFSIELSEDCTSEEGGKVNIGGVELLVRESESQTFQTVYRSPCVDRWIDPMTAWNRAPFRFDDDAWCFTIGTSTVVDARTNDDHVYVDLALSSPLTLSPNDWLGYYQADSTHVSSYGGYDYLRVLLNHVSYDDWTEGARDSYGFTFNSGGYAIPDVRLRINGGNRWTVSDFLAVTYRPGDTDFLDYQTCQRLDLTGLNTNLDGDNPSMASALPGSNIYYSLATADPDECADLSTIQCTNSTVNFCVGE